MELDRKELNNINGGVSFKTIYLLKTTISIISMIIKSTIYKILR